MKALQTLPTHPGLPRGGDNQAKAKDAAQWLTDGHVSEGWDVAYNRL
jgi:hypothetical protein